MPLSGGFTILYLATGTVRIRISAVCRLWWLDKESTGGIFPVMTCVLVSLLLTGIVWLVGFFPVEDSHDAR